VSHPRTDITDAECQNWCSAVLTAERQRDDAQIELEQSREMLYRAWVVIANASDWRQDDDESLTWRAAAERWRDAWHATLADAPV
jgi:hypothetical protein